MDQTGASDRTGGPTPEPNRLCVLLVVANRSYGGAERHVVDLAGELTRLGHDVTCLYPSSSGLGDMLAPGVRPVGARDMRSAHRLAAEIRRTLGRRRFDIVHFHSPRATLAGRLVVRAMPRRIRPAVVSTAHGWIPRRLALRRVYEALYLATTGLDDATIAVSRDTAGRFGRWGGPVRVVPNGIRRAPELGPYVADPCRGAPGPGERPGPGPGERPIRLGFLGRLTEEKGFSVALGAFELAAERLAKAGRSLELHVYGDGLLLPEVRRRARAGVRFYGWVAPSEVTNALSGLSLLLLTSYEEGLPYVALEAMAAGCPVLASAVGGLPDLIEDGVTGWLIPPGDPDAAARVVEVASTVPGLAAKVRRTAWEKVGSYTVSRMASETEAVYRAALSRRGAAKGGRPR